METLDINKIWNEIDGLIGKFDKEQLKSILMKKNRKIFYDFVIMLSVSALSCLGFIIYLVISAFLMYPDMYYMMINLLLILFLTIILISSIRVIKKLNVEITEKVNLHDVVQQRVGILEQTCTQFKYQNLLSVVFLVLFNLSIHLLIQRKPFLEIFFNPVSLLSLAIGLITSITIGLYLSKKIIKHYDGKLQELKNNLKEF